MKNISLFALLTALAVTPTHVLAFSDAAIAQTDAAFANKQALEAALGRKATQAEIDSAKALPADATINALTDPANAAFKDTLMNFIVAHKALPGGIAEVTAPTKISKKAKIAYTSLEVRFATAAGGATVGQGFIVKDNNFANGINKGMGEHIAYGTAVNDGEYYKTLNDQVQ